MKVLKVDTGVCARCGSHFTGVIKGGKDGKFSFRFGSPVLYVKHPDDRNCICFRCGMRWYGEPKVRLVDYSEIDLLLKLRLAEERGDVGMSVSTTMSLDERDAEWERIADDEGVPALNHRQKKIRQKATGNENVPVQESLSKRMVKGVLKDTFVSPFSSLGPVLSGMSGQETYDVSETGEWAEWEEAYEDKKESE